MAAIVWTPITNGNGFTMKATSGSDFVAGTFTGTTSSTEGMSLQGVGAFAVYIVGDLTRTISAAGGALAYVQDPWSGLWHRAEVYDIAAGTVTGVRGVYVGGFSVISPQGRIGYVNSGFTVSAGALECRIIPTAQARNGAGELV